MPHTTSTSSPNVSGATNAPILPSSSPLSSLASSSNPPSNPPTPSTRPVTPPPIITVSSTSPTPSPKVPLIPGHFIREISDLSDTDVISELDHIYRLGEWPKSPMVFQNSSPSLLCLTVFGPHATLSAYKQENTILCIYLPREITNPNDGSCGLEEESADEEYVAIKLSSSGLTNDGLFTAAKDAWALYRDDEGVLEELLVEFPHSPAAGASTFGASTVGASTAGPSTACASIPDASAAGASTAGASDAGAGTVIPGAAAAAATVSGENEDEEKMEAEGELIRVTRGDEEGWTKFLVEVNDWNGWVKEEVKRVDGGLESGQLHVKVQVLFK